MVPRSTDLPVAVAVRRLRCGGMAAAAPAAACAQNAGCAVAAAARDVEGPRHAGNAYAGERVDARHDLGTLLSHNEITSLCDLEAKRIRLDQTTDFLTSGFGTIFTTIGGL